VGWFEDDGRTPVTQETRFAVQAAAQYLQRAGFEVEPFRPTDLETARQLWWKFFGIAGGMILGPMLEGHERDISPILNEFTCWVREEPSHTGNTLLSTWLGRDEVRGKILSQMRQFPILLCPVAAIPAFKHGERSWGVQGKTVKYLDAWSYTEWFNLLGFPAAVVPIAKSPEGVPIGVQVVGRPWEEELVLHVAAQLEAQRSRFLLTPLQA
jgi:Asp-tRNA(Asn)/Glu-tRNA(Gln) amidotransferase A subunit family amidase